MNQLPFAPLAEARPTDAVMAFIDRVAKVNAAADPAVKNYCQFQVWEAVRRVKTRRSNLESEWLAIQKMVVLMHDEGQRYIGRSNAYLPLYARIRKTLVSQITKGLFPSDEYMDVVDREQGDNEEAKACKEVLRYEFDCAARIREFIKPFVGQFVDLGIAPLKAWYRTDKVFQGKRKLITDVQAYPDEGLTVSARSIFNVVVYPEWAEHERDLRIVAERLEIPHQYAKAMSATKRWVNVEEAISSGSGAGADQFDWAINATLATLADIPGMGEMRDVADSPQRSVIAVEAWCEVPFPRAFYGPSEDPNLPLPARVLFVNGIPVSVTRNPFYHQRSPFLFARDNIVAGSFYSNGTGRLVRNLQYLANDFANQTNDVGIHGLNPMWLVNPAYFAGPPGPIRPGGLMKVRDVKEAAVPISPKVELVQHGMPLLQMLISFANDGGGAPPVSQGTKAATTATSTQILANNAATPIQDAVEDIEAQVMVPLMKLTWSLSQQYRDKALIRRIADPNGVEGLAAFLPSEIDIDPEFRFLSSSQAANRQARTQQMQTFMQMAAELGELLAAQGMAIDARAALERFWTDGLGFRGFKNIVKPITLLQQQAMQNGVTAPPSPQASPTPGVPTAPEGGSAVPQGNVAPPDVEPAPGEGDVMPDVLANGQQIAGLGGGVP